MHVGEGAGPASVPAGTRVVGLVSCCVGCLGRLAVPSPYHLWYCNGPEKGPGRSGWQLLELRRLSFFAGTSEPAAEMSGEEPPSALRLAKGWPAWGSFLRFGTGSLFSLCPLLSLIWCLGVPFGFLVGGSVLTPSQLGSSRAGVLGQ